MTKHDVMRETGLPRTTVIRSLGELEKAGWASADGSSDRRRVAMTKKKR